MLSSSHPRSQRPHRLRQFGPRGQFIAAVITCLLFGATIASGQPRKANPVDDLRPAYATSVDVTEGKRVADDLCARCHGASGTSAASGVPHVAGQRPSYLYNKLRAYQTGARDDHAMEGAVKFLNDDALVKLAAYYANLDPALPAAADAATKSVAPLDPLAAGKAAAAACAGCHGETGVSATAGMPSLIGFDEKYFVAAMNAYRSSSRQHEMMKTIAMSVSEAEVRHMALFYALQKPAAAQTPSRGNAAAGKAASAACAGCHGEHGVSSSPANPSLAGQDAEYFVAAMHGYRNGTRAEETMKLAAAGLSEPAIADLAAYYARQQPQQPKVIKPLTLAEWVQRCDRCHGINGNSTDPRTPAIAAQRVDYLQKALKAYQGSQRRSSVMAGMSASLTDADVASLAAFYARQKARPFVFVMVPAR
jgi:cytochrome c553